MNELIKSNQTSIYAYNTVYKRRSQLVFMQHPSLIPRIEKLSFSYFSPLFTSIGIIAMVCIGVFHILASANDHHLRLL